MKPGNNADIAYIVYMGAGLETFVYREVDSMFNMGKKILLFATKYKTKDIFAPKKEWPFHTLTAVQLVVRSPWLVLRALMRPRLLWSAIRDRALVDLVFALDFVPVMRKRRVRQIHCHHGDHKLFIGYYCKLMTGLPLTVTIHAAEFYTNPNPALFRKAVTSCDAVFPISRRWYNKLRDEYGVAEERLRLNRLYVDVSLYKPVSRISVLAVGRFTERKGFQYLLEAARLLKNENIHFCVVGFGGLDIAGLAERLGVSEKVTIFNKMNQEQLRYLYQNVDILCVPSITTEEEGAEGIPVVLMEGMACGLPVVATRCGAIDEIVDHIVVDERSADQLADGLKTLIDNPQLRQEYGERNRRFVVEHYSASNVRKFAEGLESVLVNT